MTRRARSIRSEHDRLILARSSPPPRFGGAKKIDRAAKRERGQSPRRVFTSNPEDGQPSQPSRPLSNSQRNAGFRIFRRKYWRFAVKKFASEEASKCGSGTANGDKATYRGAGYWPQRRVKQNRRLYLLIDFGVDGARGQILHWSMPPSGSSRSGLRGRSRSQLWAGYRASGPREIESMGSITLASPCCVTVERTRRLNTIELVERGINIEQDGMDVPFSSESAGAIRVELHDVFKRRLNCLDKTRKSNAHCQRTTKAKTSWEVGSRQ